MSLKHVRNFAALQTLDLDSSEVEVSMRATDLSDRSPVVRQYVRATAETWSQQLRADAQHLPPFDFTAPAGGSEHKTMWLCVERAAPLSAEEKRFAEDFDLHLREPAEQGPRRRVDAYNHGSKRRTAWQHVERLTEPAWTSFDQKIVVDDVCTQQQLQTAAARKKREGQTIALALLRTKRLSVEFMTERLLPADEDLPFVLAAHQATRRAERSATAALT